MSIFLALIGMSNFLALIGMLIFSRCDEGFEGEDCHPATHLNDRMQADFGIRYHPDTHFENIRGGKVVSSNRGCGNIHSDESLYFFDVCIYN